MTEIAVVTGAGRGFGKEIARRLAARGFAVLATDVDAASAEATAAELGDGSWSMQLDVRDPDAHRAAAAAADERGRLKVWVNNAGVLRTEKAWEHDDATVRLISEVNFLGVVWGCRAAVDVMRRAPGGEPSHIINMASLSSLGPAPGLAVYGATKHAVLGFTESLQGDLRIAKLPIACHAVCPDGADTEMVRERVHDEDAALIWSAPRLLTAEEVADKVVGLLDSKQLVLVIPRWRGWVARTIALAPRPGLALVGPLRWLGERRRAE